MAIPKHFKLFACIIIVCSFLACDDVITVETTSANPVMIIDARVNDKSEAQKAYLTFSQDYFENDRLPPQATGAQFFITDYLGNEFEFLEVAGNTAGAYQWKPRPCERLVMVGSSLMCRLSGMKTKPIPAQCAWFR